MKKILLIFANSSVKKGYANAEKLKELLQSQADNDGRAITVYVTFARSLSYIISNSGAKIRDHRNHLDLEEYDFVYFRKAGAVMQQMLTCALYLEDHNIPYYDTEIGKTNSRNKLSQMYMMHRAGLNIPTTLYCRNNRRLLRLVQSASIYASFSFPVIAKATGGTRGDANYLVHSLDELRTLLANEHRHFLIQNFIPNDGDMRLFIAGQAVMGVIHRKAVSDSHLNNTSKGGTAELLPVRSVPAVIKHDAQVAANIFNRDCAGVDIIINKDTKEHFILEVNRAPQIEESSFEHEKAEWMTKAFSNTMRSYKVDNKSDATTFGWLEEVVVEDEEDSCRLIAKIDTGAYTSSVHATDIKEAQGNLYCTIAGKKMTLCNYTKKLVKSSNGQIQERYLVTLKVNIGNREYSMRVTLTDRQEMNYEMLIGRAFLRNQHILCDVTRRYITSKVENNK